jgi:hypothetical protein
MRKACAAKACLSACGWGASICAGHGRSLEDTRLRPCPGGTIENSPTFQRWKPNHRRVPVPEGRLTSPAQVTLVVGNPVFLEQRQELLPKGHLPVVLRLALDVMNAQSQPSLRDSCNAEHASPTLKRWAILGMSLRDKYMPDLKVGQTAQVRASRKIHRTLGPARSSGQSGCLARTPAVFILRADQ